jgi:vacuolar-type H+-ATPase subunit E/Vma4
MKKVILDIAGVIQEEAGKHSAEYIKQAKNQTDADTNYDIAAYDGEINKRMETLKKYNELEYDRMTERLASRLNREILTYQHILIDEIFDMAVLKLKQASKEEFKNMLGAIIEQLEGSFTLYFGELSADKLGKEETERLIGEKNAEIVVGDTFIPKKSGFILADAQIEYNCLFEDLIEDKKNEQTALILKEVFGDSQNKLF